MGDTIGLWEDSIHQQPFSLKYPNLYAYENNKNMSMKAALVVPNLLQIFRLPMSRMAYNEFLFFTIWTHLGLTMTKQMSGWRPL
jgi:hypothetical protein